jgi:hypothetical protein
MKNWNVCESPHGAKTIKNWPSTLQVSKIWPVANEAKGAWRQHWSSAPVLCKEIVWVPPRAENVEEKHEMVYHDFLHYEKHAICIYIYCLYILCRVWVNSSFRRTHISYCWLVTSHYIPCMMRWYPDFRWREPPFGSYIPWNIPIGTP